MRKSSQSVHLLFMGSALALAGCGGAAAPQAANPCVGPDGQPKFDANGQPMPCTHTTRRTAGGGFMIIPFPMGGGGGRAGVSAPAVTSGGFGSTGGHASGISGGGSAAS